MYMYINANSYLYTDADARYLPRLCIAASFIRTVSFNGRFRAREVDRRMSRMVNLLFTESIGLPSRGISEAAFRIREVQKRRFLPMLQWTSFMSLRV